MAYPEIDLNLTDEQKALRDLVKKFGAEVMRPAGIKLDKLGDPADVIAPGSILWDVFKQYRELDLHAMGFSKRIGGTAEDMDPMMGILALEEMGYADAGLAISLGVASMPFTACQYFPVPELQDLARQYVQDKDCKLIGCWGITEPDHGGDWSLGGDKPECGPSLRGVMKGDEYIINGQKSAWVSNGTIATHSLLHVGLDPSRGMQGQGIAICPLDLPGITRGKPLNKIGQRPLNQGEIFFDDVHLPKKYMIMTPRPASEIAGGSGLFSGGGIPMGSMAVMFGGLARAALDEAINIKENLLSEPVGEGQVNLHYGVFYIIDRMDPLHAEEYVKMVREVLEDLESRLRESQELHASEKNISEIARVQRKLGEELAIIRLRRIVPGRCKFCPL